MTSQVMTTEQLRAQRKPDDVEASFNTYRGFQAMSHMAESLANSSIIPEAFRNTIMVKDRYDSQAKKWVFKPESNPNGVSNCIIALNMAQRLGADPMMIMQNLYLVDGRPSWSSQFIIAAINSSGRYSPLRFDVTGDDQEVEIPYAVTEWVYNSKSNKKEPVESKQVARVKNMKCVAWVIEKATGERLESTPITMEMAVKEGWYQKNGSKWQSMPEQMLRYRAASFFGRIYAPDLLMGLKTQEEEQDAMIDVTPPEPTVQELPVTLESIKQNVVKSSPVNTESSAVEQVQEVEQPKKIRSRTPKVVEEALAVEAVAEQNPTQISQAVKGEYMVALTGATQLDAIATLENEINKDSRLLDNQRSNLISYIETRRRVVNEALAKETEAQSPAADPIKSLGIKTGLQRNVTEAADLDALKIVAANIREYKPKLTAGHMNEVLADYSARKKFLEDQQDMFAGVEEVSYVDSVIARIQNAKSQDDINAVYADPAFDELSGADRDRIDGEAQQREAELQD